jgi:sugar phosphate isomerase/epimerase
MLRGVSTYPFIKERLHPGILDQLVRGGAQVIEIHADRHHFDYANRKQHVREIGDWFRDGGAKLLCVHAPQFTDYESGRAGGPPVNITASDRAQGIQAMDEIKRAIEIAEQIPFRYLIQHIGIAGDEFDEKKNDAAMTCIEHLRAFAKPLGVSILLENIPNEFSQPEKLVEFIRAAHFEDVGICLDLGHAHLMTTVAEAFETVKNHIASAHIHDNNKDRDAHLWPGKGTIDWNEAVSLLDSAPDDLALVLEIEAEDQKKDISADMTAAYKKLEQL